MSPSFCNPGCGKDRISDNCVFVNILLFVDYGSLVTAVKLLTVSVTT